MNRFKPRRVFLGIQQVEGGTKLRFFAFGLARLCAS